MFIPSTYSSGTLREDKRMFILVIVIAVSLLVLGCLGAAMDSAQGYEGVRGYIMCDICGDQYYDGEDHMH